MNYTAFPLQWPAWWERTPENRRERARFKRSLAEARDHLYKQLELIGAGEVVVSSNATLKLDGQLAARQNAISDPGVAVYFVRKGEPKCYPVDKFDRLQDNVNALANGIEAIRSLERWGMPQAVDAAFAGFAALPESTGGEAWWDVLGLPGPTKSPGEIIIAYRAMVRLHHPDAGGDPDRFRRIQDAYEQGEDQTP